METQLKARLLGAVAVVAIAVVFVPMILDGKNPESGQTRVINAPGNAENYPSTRMAGHSFSLSDPSGPSGETIRFAGETSQPSGHESIVQGNGNTIASASAQPAGSVAINGSRPTVPVAPEARPSASNSNSSAASASPPPTRPAPAADPVPARPRTGYTVQVGSFAVKNNAQQRVDELRAKGFNSFLDQVKVGTETRYRVRVGSRPKRSEALKLGNELKQKTGLSFFVTSID